MNANEQQTHLFNELSNVINRFVQEYDLSAPSIVGVLEILKTEIMLDNIAEDRDEK